MNERVAKTSLILCIIYLAVFYVMKFFFPELLVQTISSPTLIRLGDFVSIWIGFDYIISGITLGATLYLFSCACSARFILNKIEWVAILVLVVVNSLVFDFLPELYTHTSISSMLGMAWLCKGKISYTAITFIIHGYLTQFLLAIRGFETVMHYFNPVSGLLIHLEGFVWLALLGIIFHLKEKNNGQVSSPLREQAS